MININLIAQRRAHKQRSLRARRIGFYGLMGAAVAIALIYLGLQMTIMQRAADIANVDQQLQDPKLVADIRQVDMLEGEMAMLRPRVDLLERVHDTHNAWLNVMFDVSARLPSDVWIDNIASRSDATAQLITIKGTALKQRTVGSFMLNLKDTRWAGDPELNFTQSVDMAARKVVSFEMTVPLVPNIETRFRPAAGAGAQANETQK